MNPYHPPQTDTAGNPSPVVDRERLRKVAAAQRHLNLATLCYCVVWFLFRDPATIAVANVAAVIVTLAYAFFAIRMAHALYSLAVTVLLAVPAIIPLVNLLVLLVLNNRATAHLRAAGIKVGLLGADPSEVRRVLGSP
jgi:hypothetical protein